MSNDINYNKIDDEGRADAALANSIKLDINTMLIVQVLAFDAATQTVSVQPVIKTKVYDPTSTTIVYSRLGEPVPIKEIQLPPLKNVPICYPRAGTFMITLPITIGDTGMLIISQKDIALWKQQGGIQSEGELSLFDINDGVYLPYVPNMVNKISDYDATALEIRAGSDKIKMAGDGKVLINGVDFVTHKHDKGTYVLSSGSIVSGTTGAPQ
jgi:hypothetical protein